MGSLSKVTGVSKLMHKCLCLLWSLRLMESLSKVTAWGLCLRLLWSLRLMESLSKVTAWGNLSEVTVVPKINGVPV